MSNDYPWTSLANATTTRSTLPQQQQECVLRPMRAFGRHRASDELSKVDALTGDSFQLQEDMTMNMETNTMNPMGGSTTGTGMTGSSAATGSAAMDSAAGNVQRVAQKAHQAVDKLEHTLTSGTGRVMDWQQEYGEMAREQIRANPLAVVAGAFALGYVLAKLTR